MYHAKIPAVAAEIERRIQRNIYLDNLPPVSVLQQEFHTAKQTITEAVRLLSERGITECLSRRTGMKIHRENLLSGTILVISKEDRDRTVDLLEREFKSDGLSMIYRKDSRISISKEELPPDLRGVLFINSALTVEWAEFLSKEKIPFVSCNQIFSFPKVNMVDYDMDANMTFLLRYLLDRGYHRIGLFYSGRLEGFNEIYWRQFRRLKRKLGLEIEPFDNIKVLWSGTYLEKLEYTIRKMNSLQCFPEILISFCDLRNLFRAVEQDTGIDILKKCDLMMLRTASVPMRKKIPGLMTFYMGDEVQFQLWQTGYNRLRELICSNGSQSPELRLIRNTLVLDQPE